VIEGEPFFFAGAGEGVPPNSESEPKSIEPPLDFEAGPGLPTARVLPCGFDGPTLLSKGNALDVGGVTDEGSVEVGLVLVGAFSILLSGADSSGAGVCGIALGAGVVVGTGGDCSADDAA
jgi:hypothetical protein